MVIKAHCLKKLNRKRSRNNHREKPPRKAEDGHKKIAQTTSCETWVQTEGSCSAFEETAENIGAFPAIGQPEYVGGEMPLCGIRRKVILSDFYSKTVFTLHAHNPPITE